MLAWPAWLEPLSTIQKDGAGGGVGLDGHHVVDEPVEGLFAGLGFDPVEEVGVVDVPAGQVGEGAVAPVVELEPSWPARRRRRRRMLASQRLQL